MNKDYSELALSESLEDQYYDPQCIPCANGYACYETNFVNAMSIIAILLLSLLVSSIFAGLILCAAREVYKCGQESRETNVNNRSSTNNSRRRPNIEAPAYRTRPNSIPRNSTRNTDRNNASANVSETSHLLQQDNTTYNSTNATARRNASANVSNHNSAQNNNTEQSLQLMQTHIERCLLDTMTISDREWRAALFHANLEVVSSTIIAVHLVNNGYFIGTDIGAAVYYIDDLNRITLLPDICLSPVDDPQSNSLIEISVIPLPLIENPDKFHVNVTRSSNLSLNYADAPFSTNDKKWTTSNHFSYKWKTASLEIIEKARRKCIQENHVDNIHDISSDLHKIRNRSFRYQYFDNLNDEMEYLSQPKEYCKNYRFLYPTACTLHQITNCLIFTDIKIHIPVKMFAYYNIKKNSMHSPKKLTNIEYNGNNSHLVSEETKELPTIMPNPPFMRNPTQLSLQFSIVPISDSHDCVPRALVMSLSAFSHPNLPNYCNDGDRIKYYRLDRMMSHAALSHLSSTKIHDMNITHCDIVSYQNNSLINNPDEHSPRGYNKFTLVSHSIMTLEKNNGNYVNAISHTLRGTTITHDNSSQEIAQPTTTDIPSTILPTTDDTLEKTLSSTSPLPRKNSTTSEHSEIQRPISVTDDVLADELLPLVSPPTTKHSSASEISISELSNINDAQEPALSTAISTNNRATQYPEVLSENLNDNTAPVEQTIRKTRIISHLIGE